MGGGGGDFMFFWGFSGWFGRITLFVPLGNMNVNFLSDDHDDNDYDDHHDDNDVDNNNDNS